MITAPQPSSYPQTNGVQGARPPQQLGAPTPGAGPRPSPSPPPGVQTMHASGSMPATVAGQQMPAASPVAGRGPQVVPTVQHPQHPNGLPQATAPIHHQQQQQQHPAGSGLSTGQANSADVSRQPTDSGPGPSRSQTPAISAPPAPHKMEKPMEVSPQALHPICIFIYIFICIYIYIYRNVYLYIFLVREAV